MAQPTAAAASRRTGSLPLWYALFGGATAWFTGLCVAYFLVTPSCVAGTELYLHLLAAITTAVGAGAAATGALLWRASGERLPGDGGGRRDRTRFLAAIGTALSGIFTLVLLAQWLATAMHAPCDPVPRLRDSPDAHVRSVQPPYG